MNKFKSIIYKALPHIYNIIPSEEVNYALSVANAKLFRRDSAMVINGDKKLKIAGNSRREAKKAERSGLRINHTCDIDVFWENVLEPNLIERFDVKPVHTLNEIKLLMDRFDKNIVFFSGE
jgi:hypothetical protein